MQKLVWTNSDGDSIDLTSGNYGITNWEGFSNTSLNIQSQQVPFQDGGVFLDALLEQRELSVTLAMQDNGNLEDRYRMRRELIHALNPKLGEGYLIYKNDFTEKRIKCIAQVPLFETHNSNDSGTPKATLVWNACDPYWEDLEETEIIFSKFKKPIINNEGDINVPVNIVINSQGIDTLKVYNQINNKSIEIKNNTHFQILIKTGNGEKSVMGGNVKAELQTINLRLSAKLQKENVIYFGTQNGYLIKTENYFKTVSWIKKISDYPIIQIYEHDSKYFICCSEILEEMSGTNRNCEMYITEDFESYTKYESLGRKILYSELFQKYAIVKSLNRIEFRNDDFSIANSINFTGSPSMIDVCETNEAVYCINSLGQVFRFEDINNYTQISNNIIQLLEYPITCCVGDGDYAYFVSEKKTCAYKHGTGAIFLNGGIRAEKDNYYGGVIIDGRILVVNGSVLVNSDNLITEPYIYYYDEYQYLHTGSLQFSKTRDLSSYEIVKNSNLSNVANIVFCIGILNNEIYLSYSGNVYKTKDFKILEVVDTKGITTYGMGVFNNVDKAFMAGRDGTGYYINIYDKEWNLKRLSAGANEITTPAIYCNYLDTIIARGYYEYHTLRVYDKENNKYITLSPYTGTVTINWVCEKGKYLYYGTFLNRITCVDMEHLTESEYKTEIVTGITAEGINGCIYITSNNYFIAWDINGNIYRSSNVADWETFNVCESKINKCIWNQDNNILVVLTESDGVYFVNVNTFEKKHIIITETEEAFFDGVFYNGNFYFISSLAVYKVNVVFEDNIINQITNESDMSFNLEKGENLIGYEGSKDFSLSIQYRQKYIGV